MVEFTHVDKMMFPEAGVTKGDLLDYYEKIADMMVPHVKNRPLMLQRFPQSRVDMFTKTSNRRPRRSFQHQWDVSGNHSGHRLCFRTHTPAYRKIEHHLRTLDVPPTH